MVPALKPHEGQEPVLRCYFYFRLLNEETRKLRVALPTLEENLDALGILISLLDLKIQLLSLA